MRPSPGLKRKHRSGSTPNLAALPSPDMPLDFGFRELDEEEQQTLEVSAPSGARSVEVLFHTEQGERAFHLESVEAMMWLTHSYQAVVKWFLRFVDTGLRPGMYSFSFLVDGVRTLSAEHPVYGQTNFGLFHARMRRYIIACNPVDGHERQPIVFDRAVSCDAIFEERRLPRARSLSNLADAVDAEDAVMADALCESGQALPDSIVAPLLGRSLSLRLLGFSLPEAAHPAEQARDLKLSAGAWRITKPTAPVCEDAFFVADHCLGVADGVGGMAQFKEHGVDSAEYAAGLMRVAQASLHEQMQGITTGTEFEAANMAQAADMALAALEAADSQAEAFGAATATVLALRGNVVGVANLGDSGFMVLRQGKNGLDVVKRSEEQQHGWNFPFQLTNFPPALAQRFAKLQVDRAKDSDLYTCDVRVGDLILLYSDGLSDNVFEKEVLETVGCALGPAFGDLLGLSDHATPAQNVAQALAELARLRSQDERANVPFTDYSWRFGYDCPGGKEDDITVVAAWVVPGAMGR